MSRVEDRLRDALAAEATRLEPAPDAWAEQRRRIAARARRVRILAAAAAAVALVAGVALVTTRDREAGLTTPPPSASPSPVSSASPTPSGMPRWFAAMSVDGTRLTVHDSVTGKYVGNVGVADRDAEFTAIAAGAQPGAFYGAERLAGGCHGRVKRQTYYRRGQGSGVTVVEPAGGSEIPGEVSDMAVSPAEDLLAMVVSRAVSGDECVQAELWVRNLRTGATTVWKGPSAGGASDELGDTLSHLSFSPDGRRLAYEANVCCGDRDPGFYVLDLDAPGRDYLKARKVGGWNPADPTFDRLMTFLPAYRVTDLVVFTRYRDGGWVLRPLDPVTFAKGTALTELRELPKWMDASATGHLLVTYDDGEVVRTAPDGTSATVGHGVRLAVW